MIIHRYHDGSEGYEYQVGDRVIVERTIHGGWFDHGPTRSERCIVEKIEHFKTRSWQIADLYIRYSDDWGTAFCYPWMIKPHPDTVVSAEVVLVNQAPQTSSRGIELTEWERSKLAWHASSSAMTYVSHHVTGRHGKSGLRPDEIEEMERWKALSAKLQPALKPEGSADE